MTWLDPAAALRLPPGAAVVVERTRHSSRLRGRILGRVGDEWLLRSYGGRELALNAAEIRRARTVASLFDPADPVLLVGASIGDWRGGVVRSEGRQVLVEQMDGAFAWFDEDRLERPEDRLPSGQAAQTA